MKIKKFQEGGVAPAPAQEQQDPMAVLVQMAQEGLQTQNCELMAQVCEGLLMMIQQMSQSQPQQPVFKRGGKIERLR